MNVSEVSQESASQGSVRGPSGVHQWSVEGSSGVRRGSVRVRKGP